MEEAEKREKHSVDSAPCVLDQTADEHKELREELQEKLNLKDGEKEERQKREAAAEKLSSDQSEDELESRGEENGNESERAESDDEKKGESFKGIGRHQSSRRPDAEDCAYQMKTGTSKSGSNRKGKSAKKKVKEGDASAEAPGLTECKYYVRTGGCKYGKACRYSHSKARSSVLPVLEVNFLGLPIRPGEKECPYYMRNGSCKYESSCRFNHPDPTAAEGSEAPAFVNDGSTSLKCSSQSSIGSWSSPRALNETAPFVPRMFPPAQGVPSHSTEWNGYQGPVYPPEQSIHPPPIYVISNPASDTNVYAHQQHQMLVDEFPEQPGQPESGFFMHEGNSHWQLQRTPRGKQANFIEEKDPASGDLLGDDFNQWSQRILRNKPKKHQMKQETLGHVKQGTPQTMKKENQFVKQEKQMKQETPQIRNKRNEQKSRQSDSHVEGEAEGGPTMHRRPWLPKSAKETETKLQANQQTNKKTDMQANQQTIEKKRMQANQQTNKKKGMQANQAKETETKLQANQQTNKKTEMQANQQTNEKKGMQANQQTNKKKGTQANQAKETETKLQANQQTNKKIEMQSNQQTNEKKGMQANQQTNKKKGMQANQQTNKKNGMQANQ